MNFNQSSFFLLGLSVQAPFCSSCLSFRCCMGLYSFERILSWSSKGGRLGFTHSFSEIPVTAELGETWTQWASFQIKQEQLKDLRLLGSLVIVSKFFPFWPFPISYCSRTFSWNIRTERCHSTLTLGNATAVSSSSMWNTFTSSAHVTEQMRRNSGNSSWTWTSFEYRSCSRTQEMSWDSGSELVQVVLSGSAFYPLEQSVFFATSWNTVLCLSQSPPRHL